MLKAIEKISQPPSRTNIDEPTIPDTQNFTLGCNFTTDEYLYVLSKTKTKSAPGSDCISNEIIRNLTQKTHDFILELYNDFFNTGEYPNSWKEYTVILIPKPKGNGYRPISLAQNLLKNFENILKNRMDWFTENNLDLPNSQYGFRKMRSGQDSVAVLTTGIASALSKGNSLGALFIDIEGAFDFVIPNLLIKDLIDIGYPANIIKFIKFLLTSRYGEFFLEGKLVKKINIIKGSLQGERILKTTV